MEAGEIQIGEQRSYVPAPAGICRRHKGDHPAPVGGAPRQDYAEMFVPGEEAIEEGGLRVTVLGSGNPWNTRTQASASILVEVGNPASKELGKRWPGTPSPDTAPSTRSV